MSGELRGTRLHRGEVLKLLAIASYERQGRAIRDELLARLPNREEAAARLGGEVLMRVQCGGPRATLKLSCGGPWRIVVAVLPRFRGDLRSLQHLALRGADNWKTVWP